MEHENRQQNAGGANGAAEQVDHGRILERAVKAAAVAALAGTTAVAANKALSSRAASEQARGGDGDGDDRRSRGAEGRGGAGAGRQAGAGIRSAAGQAVGQVAEVLTPVAESLARSAGTWAATASPELLRDTVFPGFIEAFNEARGRRSSAGKRSRADAEPRDEGAEPDDEREAGRREREARREERRNERAR